MTSSDTTRTSAEGREVVVERVFDAPREQVWRAWTQAEQFQRWYGPAGFTVPICEIDFRVGGRHVFGMRSPDGWEYTTAGVFLEIEPIARFVATDTMADAEGNIVPGAIATTVTVTLEDLGEGRTKVTVRQAGWTDEHMAAGAAGGWSQALDKLAILLAGG